VFGTLQAYLPLIAAYFPISAINLLRTTGLRITTSYRFRAGEKAMVGVQAVKLNLIV
jgi:hypothetical protein